MQVGGWHHSGCVACLLLDRAVPLPYIPLVDAVSLEACRLSHMRESVDEHEEGRQAHRTDVPHCPPTSSRLCWVLSAGFPRACSSILQRLSEIKGLSDAKVDKLLGEKQNLYTCWVKPAGSAWHGCSTHMAAAPPPVLLPDPAAEAARKSCPQFGILSAKEYEAMRQASIGEGDLRE